MPHGPSGETIVFVARSTVPGTVGWSISIAGMTRRASGASLVGKGVPVVSRGVPAPTGGSAPSGVGVAVHPRARTRG
jgi:hypothetical protein